MIALVDAGCGNLRSVQRALEYVGAKSIEITRDPERVASADRVVFPGQGAFGDCVRALDADGSALRQAINQVLVDSTPFLGICIGMQVLFESSDEAPGAVGLGHFDGAVRRIPDGLVEPDGAAVKVPHMGWNLARTQPGYDRALGEDRWYYFVHSYHCVPRDPSVVAARSEHGVEFAAAVARDNVLAVQFHPEKSQRAGLSLLERWLDASGA
jgi:glutamine amidotransferase